MTPARFHEDEDIHRANSPLAGQGQWPVKWRVFLRDGRVTGVFNYYGWGGRIRTYGTRYQRGRCDPFPATAGLCWNPTSSLFTLLATRRDPALDRNPAPGSVDGYLTAALSVQPECLEADAKFVFTDCRHRCRGIGSRLGASLVQIGLIVLDRLHAQDPASAPRDLRVHAAPVSDGGRRLVDHINAMAETAASARRTAITDADAGMYASWGRDPGADILHGA